MFLLYNLQHTLHLTFSSFGWWVFCLWYFNVSKLLKTFKHLAFCQDYEFSCGERDYQYWRTSGRDHTCKVSHLCEWFDAVPAACRLQNSENKCYIWVDYYYEYKHGNWSGSEIWKSFCKGCIQIQVLSALWKRIMTET